MFRTFAASLAMLTAVPAFAAQYLAVPQSAASATMVVKDLRWTCGATGCSATRTGTSPDAHVCTAVARKLGTLEGFSAGGRAFDPGQLEKCNRAAQ